MTYRMDDTKWGFTAPHEGEVNSARLEANRIREYDDASLSPQQVLQLTSNGNSSIETTFGVDEDGNPVDMTISAIPGDELFTRDEYQSDKLGRDVYVTRQHYHPTPSSVPVADWADRSERADTADSAEVAERLAEAVRINGHEFDGTQDVYISFDDYDESRRIWYGTEDPSGVDWQAVSPNRGLRPGDVYVRYSDVTNGAGGVDVIDGSYAVESISEPYIRELIEEPGGGDDGGEDRPDVEHAYAVTLYWDDPQAVFRPEDIAATLSTSNVNVRPVLSDGKASSAGSPKNLENGEARWYRDGDRWRWVAELSSISAEVLSATVEPPYGYVPVQSAQTEDSSSIVMRRNGTPLFLGIRSNSDGDIVYELRRVSSVDGSASWLSATGRPQYGEQAVYGEQTQDMFGTVSWGDRGAWSLFGETEFSDGTIGCELPYLAYEDGYGEDGAEFGLYVNSFKSVTAEEGEFRVSTRRLAATLVHNGDYLAVLDYNQDTAEGEMGFTVAIAQDRDNPYHYDLMVTDLDYAPYVAPEPEPGPEPEPVDPYEDVEFEEGDFDFHGADGRGYATLQDAIDANAYAVLLARDLVGAVTVGAGYSVEIDLRGRSVSSSGYEPTVTVNGSLSVVDTLEGGLIVSERGCGVMVGDNASFSIGGGGISAADGAVVTGRHTGASVSVHGGTLTSSTGPVLSGSEEPGYGGNAFSVSGGSLSSENSCCVYCPNSDTVSVSGGVLVSVNGAGIVARAGTVFVSDGEVRCSGASTVRVGDVATELPCGSIVFDCVDGWHALDDDSRIEVSGGKLRSDAASVSVLGESGVQRAFVYGGDILPEPDTEFVVDPEPDESPSDGPDDGNPPDTPDDGENGLGGDSTASDDDSDGE